METDAVRTHKLTAPRRSFRRRTSCRTRHPHSSWGPTYGSGLSGANTSIEVRVRDNSGKRYPSSGLSLTPCPLVTVSDKIDHGREQDSTVSRETLVARHHRIHLQEVDSPACVR